MRYRRGQAPEWVEEGKEAKEGKRKKSRELTHGWKAYRSEIPLTFLSLAFPKDRKLPKAGYMMMHAWICVIVKIHSIWIQFGDVLVTLVRWTCKRQGFLPVRAHLGEEPEEDLKKEQQPTYAQQHVSTNRDHFARQNNINILHHSIVGRSLYQIAKPRLIVSWCPALGIYEKAVWTPSIVVFLRALSARQESGVAKRQQSSWRQRFGALNFWMLPCKYIKLQACERL